MFVDLAVMVGAWVALVLGLLVWAVRRVGG